MKVALAQIDSQASDVEANIAKHLDFIQQAIAEKAELIVFPELSLTGDIVGPHPPDVSLSADADAIQQITKVSQDIDIVVGLAERSELNLYNRYNSAFYFSEGQVTYRHRKLFLVNYSVFDEGKHYVR
jgi:predicted amidohydrolase